MFNKKGVSVLIEYILLLAMVITLSAIVYGFLSSFVPKEPLECSDGVSVYVSDYVYQCDTNTLNLELKNNGRFDTAGYFIKATNSTAIELATIDLSLYTNGSQNGAILISGIQNANSFGVNSEINQIFTIASSLGTLNSVEIIPIRYEEIEGKTRLLSCTNAKIKQSLSCASNTANLNLLFSNVVYSYNGTAHFYNHTRTFTETNGIGVNLTIGQLCTQSSGCGTNGSVSYRINGSSNLIQTNKNFWTSFNSDIFTLKYWGVDDNSNNIYIEQYMCVKGASFYPNTQIC